MKYIIKYHEGRYLIRWRGNGSIPVFGVMKKAKKYNTKKEAIKELGTIPFEANDCDIIQIKDSE